MIMSGSNMHKAEHDRKAIMYPAMDIVLSEEIKSGQPRIHLNDSAYLTHIPYNMWPV